MINKNIWYSCIIVLVVFSSSAYSAGLVGYWEFDEASSGTAPIGSQIIDSVSTNDGEIKGGSATYVEGKKGIGALDMDGGSTYIDVPGDSNGTMFDTITTEMTVSFWVKCDSDYTSAGNVAMVTAGNGIYIAVPNQSSGMLYATAGQTESVTWNGVLDYTQWNHWAFTKDSVAGEMHAYLNGQLVGSKLDAYTPINPYPGGNPIKFFEIYAFKGAIDDYRLYDYAMTVEEIEELCPPPPPEVNLPGLVAYWKFEEGTGVHLADSAGLSDGTINNPSGGNGWVAGVPGIRSTWAYDFDYPGYADVGMPNSYGSNPNPIMPAGNEISVAFWMKGDLDIETSGNAIYGSDGFMITTPNGSTGQILWQVGGDLTGFVTPESLNWQEWNHFVFTKDAVAGTMKIYLNGVNNLVQNSRFGAIDTLTFLEPAFANYAMDDLRVYDYALTDEEIMFLYQTPIKAHLPKPENGENLVSIDSDLSWHIGEDPCATTTYQELYFGTDPNEVADANGPQQTDLNMNGQTEIGDVAVLAEQWLQAIVSTADLNEDNKVNLYDFAKLAAKWLEYWAYKGNIGTNQNYDPGMLDYDTAYFWRVDTTHDSTLYKGDVWSFATTNPIIDSDQIVSIDVSDNSTDITKIIDLSGMLGLKHGFDANDMWSTTNIATTTSPSGTMGKAWVSFEFDDLYELGELWIWNYNGSANLDVGVNDVTIEYSENGTSWTTMFTGQLDKALGGGYVGRSSEIDFDGALAKYVVITANSNWGNPSSYCGLSEVRFNLLVPKATLPEPQNLETDVSRSVVLNWGAGKNAISHDVYLGTDYQSVSEATTGSPLFESNVTGSNSYSPGTLESNTTYYWRVDTVTSSGTVKGNVWIFTTGLFTLAANPRIERFELVATNTKNGNGGNSWGYMQSKVVRNQYGEFCIYNEVDGTPPNNESWRLLKRTGTGTWTQIAQGASAERPAHLLNNPAGQLVVLSWAGVPSPFGTPHIWIYDQEGTLITEYDIPGTWYGVSGTYTSSGINSNGDIVVMQTERDTSEWVYYSSSTQLWTHHVITTPRYCYSYVFPDTDGNAQWINTWDDLWVNMGMVWPPPPVINIGFTAVRLWSTSNIGITLDHMYVSQVFQDVDEYVYNFGDDAYIDSQGKMHVIYTKLSNETNGVSEMHHAVIQNDVIVEDVLLPAGLSEGSTRIIQDSVGRFYIIGKTSVYPGLNEDGTILGSPALLDMRGYSSTLNMVYVAVPRGGVAADDDFTDCVVTDETNAKMYYYRISLSE